jgi:hypothetical protein
MKNPKILLAVIILALLYAGCRKEKEIVKGNLPGTGKHPVSGQRINLDEMPNEMNNFIYLTLHDELRSAGTYEGEDAMLIMEAALNYHTGHPASDYDDIAIDTFEFAMPLVKTPAPIELADPPSEYVLLHDSLEVLWPVILDSVAAASGRVTFDSVNDPFNIVVDLEFVRYDRESEDAEQVAIVQVTTWVGNSPFASLGCEYTVSWWADGSQQTTNGCNGNSSNLTWAAKEIQKRLGPLCNAMPACGDYMAYVWPFTINAYQTYTAPGCTPTFHITWNGPAYNSCIWAGQSDFCMGPTELQNETDGIKCTAETYLAGSIIISYKVQSFYNTSFPYIYHNCNVTNGQCLPYHE